MLDANMILRYLLNDDKDMADTAEKYLNAGDVTVTIEVIAEVVYVLKGVYKMERKDIAQTISDFLNLVNCCDIDVLKFALNTYGEHTLDFVDCVLLGYNMLRNIEIATFDKRLLKLIGTE